jgi:hypothetical protein
LRALEKALSEREKEAVLKELQKIPKTPSDRIDELVAMFRKRNIFVQIRGNLRLFRYPNPPSKTQYNEESGRFWNTWQAVRLLKEGQYTRYTDWYTIPWSHRSPWSSLKTEANNDNANNNNNNNNNISV